MSYIKKADRLTIEKKPVDNQFQIHVNVVADTPATGKLNLDRNVPIGLGMRVINILLGNDDMIRVQAIEAAKPKTLDLDVPVRKNGKVRKQQTCKNCGQPGHRRDTCPNAPQDEENVIKETGYNPTPEQKADIEDRLKEGESVMTVVSETGASLAYVNVIRARLNRDGEL